MHFEKPEARVLVAQIGARRNYCVPAAFARAGMLHTFFTDFYAARAQLIKVASQLPILSSAGSIIRAIQRVSPELATARIVHFPWFAAGYAVCKSLSRHWGNMADAYVWGGRTFASAVARHCPRGADAAYGFSSAVLEWFEALQDENTVCIVDQGTAPMEYENALVKEQEDAYPEWCVRRRVSGDWSRYVERQAREWELADIVVCPSSFCRKALIDAGVREERIRIVPHGFSPAFITTDRLREKRPSLSVLFVGNDAIRKGITDLVLALEKLKSLSLRAVYAGNQSGLSGYGLKRVAAVMELLGPVPRHQMPSVYHQADVFVLPTVSDTFPSVVLEAMASGLPVVTTPNCGASDVIRDGIDGFIVPVRAPEAIAEKLELLAKDRELLQYMSHNARQRACDFTLDRYSERLVTLVCQACSEHR